EWSRSAGVSPASGRPLRKQEKNAGETPALRHNRHCKSKNKKARLAPGLSFLLLAISYWNEIVTAVRRFSGSLTPSLVALSRLVSPRPSVEISAGAMPAATSASRTTEARRFDRPILYFAEPDVSV